MKAYNPAGCPLKVEAPAGFFGIFRYEVGRPHLFFVAKLPKNGRVRGGRIVDTRKVH